MSFIEAILVGHVINQGKKKFYSGRHACLTKENVTEQGPKLRLPGRQCD